MTKPNDRPPLTTECPKCGKTFRQSGIRVHLAYCDGAGAAGSSARSSSTEAAPPARPAPAAPAAPTKREPFNPLPDV